LNCLNMGFESVDILIQRAQVLRSRNVNQAMSLLDDALSIAQQASYQSGMAQIIRDRAACYLIQKNYKLSLTAFNEAIQFFQALGDRNGQLDCLNEISSIYFKLGDIPSAMEYILQSLKIHTDLGDSEGIANNYNELGKLYVFLQDYDNAIDHFKKGLKIFEGLKNKGQMVNSYFLLGNAYNWMNDYDKALYYLLRASNSLEQLTDIDTKAKTLGSLAILYTKQKEYEKAIGYFNEALSVAKDGASSVVKAQIQKSLANLYIDLTQYDKAIEILNNALAIAQTSPMEGQLVKIHEFLSMAYEKLGDSQNALAHYKIYSELDKHVASEEVNLKAKALHIRYDLEELRKQKEIAELSDKLKEQFLANVSHEIRTPMNGVLGMAHLLSKTSPTKEQEEYIEAIKLSANNLMVIINDILDFSKINAGKIEFNENEFNLRELIRGIIQILQVKADEKKIKIGCTIDYRIKDNLVGDPIRLNQILMNLMGNAVKFTEHGKVMLEVKLMEQHDTTCKIRMKVIDSGIGIPENKLQSIFDSFEQADNNKRRYEGTGLGLTIVKQLVELQGGDISVKSQVNNGSEFTVDMTFRMGKSEAAESVQRPEEIEAMDFSHVRVLIVEDNRVNQLLVKNMLKKFGFDNMDTAENGLLALNRLKEKDYDIVLMDIQMPEMDGYEITNEIRHRLRKEMRAIPVIAITADASDKERLKAQSAGMDDYVVKPYTPEELYFTILKYVKPADEIPSVRKDGNALSRIREAGMNLDFLEKFTGGDQDLTIQLIEIFLKQVPEAIQKLSRSIAKHDWKETHAVAHKIKSSIAVFELNELKKLLINIEEYARDGEHLDEIPPAFSAFREGARFAMRNLEAELKKLRQTQY